MPICIYGGYPFRAGDRRKRGYCSTTAVPLIVTISMLP